MTPDPADHDAETGYLPALRAYPVELIRQVTQSLEPWDGSPSPRSAPAAIHDRLARSECRRELLDRLEPPSRQALAIIHLAQPGSWSLPSLIDCVQTIGLPRTCVEPLVHLGLIALSADLQVPSPSPIPSNSAPRRDDRGRTVWPHPDAAETTRIAPPAWDLKVVHEGVVNVREADRLEAILRLSALWQRIVESPLRHTQEGTLYKRDQRRLCEDAALDGSIDDAPEPLNDPLNLWLALARAVDLVVRDRATDRLLAAPDPFWAENAVHLPELLARAWFTLRMWRETNPGPRDLRALPAPEVVRIALLIGLAGVPPDGWVGIEELAKRLIERLETRGADGEPARPSVPKEALRTLVRSILHGPAFILGLVRMGTLPHGGGSAVQLAPMGRYLLGQGAPPPPTPTFEGCLYVQPNFEVIAYRQGLNPILVGELGRFARWKKIGAAPELALTAESTYHALERGVSLPTLVERLQRHSARPLPHAVVDAIHTWAGRRDRVKFHPSATIIEFLNGADRGAAIAGWPEAAGTPPRPIADRLLLVDDSASIPFHLLRLLGARDYRQPPETCVEVSADGLTLSVDPARSDLFVSAEVARFAEESPLAPHEDRSGAPRRRFLVTRETLGHWIAAGLGASELATWFVRRTGRELPPAIALMLSSLGVEPPHVSLARTVVIRVDEPSWLDGIFQHPATAPYLLERLGASAALVREADLAALRSALAALGIQSTASLDALAE